MQTRGGSCVWRARANGGSRTGDYNRAVELLAKRPPSRMDHAIIRPSQSLVKGGGSAAQFRLSDGASGNNLALMRNAQIEELAVFKLPIMAVMVPILKAFSNPRIF